MRWVRLQHVVDANRLVLPESTPDSFEFDYIDISSVSRENGIEGGARFSFGDAPSRARRIVSTGDVIVSTVRTYLKAAASIGPDHDGDVCSTGFAVLTPRPGLSPKHLGYLVFDQRFVDEVAARSVGVSYPAINPRELLRIEVFVPGCDDQHSIAEFLDRECERIARLERELDDLVDQLVDQERGAFLGAMATRPRSLPLRRFVASIADGPFGSNLASDHYTDSPGVRVIRLGNVGLAEFLNDDKAFVAPAYAQSALREHFVDAGDLILAGLGDSRHPLGRACVVPATVLPAIHKADCYRVVADQGRCEAEFLALALSFGPSRDEAPVWSRGSTRMRLNTVVARDLPVPDLDLPGQRRVVEHMWSVRDRARRLEGEVGLMRRELTEYRDALITEAVTGKLDVARLSEQQMDESAHAAMEGERPEVLSA